MLNGGTGLFPQRLSPRHEGEDQLSAVGCREYYNYKSPHPCSPGVDCAFVVRWRTLEGEEDGKWVEFSVTASLAGLNHTSLWVALGFSSNSQMVSVRDTTIESNRHTK